MKLKTNEEETLVICPTAEVPMILYPFAYIYKKHSKNKQNKRGGRGEKTKEKREEKRRKDNKRRGYCHLLWCRLLRRSERVIGRG